MAYRPDYESADYQEGYADGKVESVKEWQGLTAKEIASITLNEYTVQTVERILKEKNNGINNGTYLRQRHLVRPL